MWSVAAYSEKFFLISIDFPFYSSVDLSAIQPNLDATIHAIQQLDVEAEQFIQKELSEFGIDILSASKTDEFKERVHVDSAVSQLQLRFQHVQQKALFSLFDLSRLPSDYTKIGTHGDVELKVLCDLYGKGSRHFRC